MGATDSVTELPSLHTYYCPAGCNVIHGEFAGLCKFMQEFLGQYNKRLQGQVNGRLYRALHAKFSRSSLIVTSASTLT